MSVAVIVGSAFASEIPQDLDLDEEVIDTDFGLAIVHRCKGIERDAFVLFRHGFPHLLLPHHINYRANAAALAALGCESLLVTSSVGVLHHKVALGTPLLVKDLIHLDNRLPNGEACTMFDSPGPRIGHLVLQDGLFSSLLSAQVRELSRSVGRELGADVTFAYAQGPRTKTPAENIMLARLGADVNSMTLAPEVILANELQISCAGLVYGHKPSNAVTSSNSNEQIAESLHLARAATTEIVSAFLHHATAVPFANSIFHF